ncbi:MAG: ribosome assembly factor SBDS [Candidatus Heimdallarchaeaceae archaeon]
MSHGYTGSTIDRRIDLRGKSIVRLETHGRRFELLVNPQPAWLFLQGEDIPVDDIFETYTVFENLSRGEKASEDDIEAVFGDMTEREIAIKILKEGALQLNQEQRQEIQKEKRQEIVDYINLHCINPRTNTPIPKDRLEKAILDLGVNIKYNEPAKDQAHAIIKQLKPIMPIRLETVKLAVKIPPSYAGSLYGTLHSTGELLQEEWLSDGSLAAVIQIPAGLQADFLEDIMNKSKGKSQVKVLERMSE